VNKQQLLELLEKEAQGRCSPEDARLLDTWYASFDDNKDKPVFKDDTHRERVRSRLLNRIHQQVPADVPDLPRYTPVKTMKRYRAALSAAAAILVLFIGGLSFFGRYHKAIPAPEKLLSTHTPVGKQLKITLTDGSTVWLNANSTLHYPAHFDGKTRTVQLEGEAFFDIAQAAAQPFIVHTEKISTIVLGTSFNINAWPQLREIHIQVATGKVGVLSGDSALTTLIADQQLTWDKNSHAFTTANRPATLANAWKEGLLNLDGASFEELSLLLYNNFGYTLQTKRKEIKAIRFSLQMKTGDHISTIMPAISRITDTHYRISDHTITMY
jgi:ferric-dicitrate binding protein FerR (iron transport regulator)